MRGDIETVNHHGSHRRLIWPVDEPARSAKVDAIIVPTARPVAYLKEAAATARSLRCPLVTLHSRQSNADEAMSCLDPSIDLIAIDVPESAQFGPPMLQTSLLLAGGEFERQTDVSAKRNLALLLCHMLRWKRVVFLDDDIRVPDPADLSRAVSLLDTHIAVGLGIGGFPDNSTVCHAFREAGGSQDTFIGAGALAVDVKRNRTFFPNVYNEDWFFVLDAGKGFQSVATVGQVLQEAYDPYSPERAQAQELGDVLAEGTFWLLDQDRSVSAGDLSHWRDFLVKREKFIEQVLDMVRCAAQIEAAERARITEALVAALDRLKRITPELCMGYLNALVTDQEQWQRHIQAIRRQKRLPLEAAIKSLVMSGAPLKAHVRWGSSPGGLNAARGRRSLVTKVPMWRRVSLGELQARIFATPPALGSRATAAMRKLPLLPWPGPTGSQAPHALVAAEVVPIGEHGHADGNGYSD